MLIIGGESGMILFTATLLFHFRPLLLVILFLAFMSCSNRFRIVLTSLKISVHIHCKLAVYLCIAVQTKI